MRFFQCDRCFYSNLGPLLFTSDEYSSLDQKGKKRRIESGLYEYFEDSSALNRIRELVSFELGKETQKGVFRLVTSVGQRKNSESPRGIEP